MRDPHIHVEKTPMPGFGHAAMRQLITEAIGLVPDLPKTVGTCCGVRRPIAMTSTRPEAITCLACRDYARAEYLRHAESAESLLDWYQREPETMAECGAMAKVTPADLAEEAQTYRALAARFEVTR